MAKTVTQTATGTVTTDNATGTVTAAIDATTEGHPVKVRMLDEALGRLSRYDAFAKAILQEVGPEHFMKGLTVLAQNDPQTALTFIRRLMKQLTRETYNAFKQLYRRQVKSARALGGGVNGFEFSVAEALDQSETYMQYMDDSWGEGADAGMATPAERRQALEEMWVPLATAYLSIESAEFAWMDNFQPRPLPYYTFQDEKGGWVELETFEEACDRMDQEREIYREEQSAKKKSAIAALADLDLTAAWLLRYLPDHDPSVPELPALEGFFMSDNKGLGWKVRSLLTAV